MKLKAGTGISPKVKIGLKQKITQKTIFGLRLLKNNYLELEEEIQRQTLENPILNFKQPENFTDTNDDLQQKEGELIKEEYETVYDDLNDSSYITYNTEKDAGAVIEEVMEYEESIQEYLMEQIMFAELTDEESKIANSIINSIDNNGYFINTIEDISEYHKVSLNKVKKVLKVIQSLDPPGIGANNHQECLLLQLERKKLKDTAAYKIIKYCYDLFINKKYALVIQRLQINKEIFLEADKIIRSLYLYPTRIFSSVDESNYILTDVIFIKHNGVWDIIINSDFSSRININKKLLSYYNNKNDKKLKKYIKNKHDDAVFLLQAINQRTNTLYNVCRALLDKQIDFFNTGNINNLKTLSLKDISKTIDMKESTISRCLSNKYAETPFGIIKLRTLISTGIINNNTGIDMSRSSIIEEISILINNEDKSKPLSDTDICNKLKLKGINIQRRTVAKYRTEAGILPKHQRKEINIK